MQCAFLAYALPPGLCQAALSKVSQSRRAGASELTKLTPYSVVMDNRIVPLRGDRVDIN